jgi:D-sedoheptulose 7-phosphate isomerase
LNETDRLFAAAWLADSVAVATDFAADPTTEAVLVAMSDAIAAALRAGGKLLIAGNGGSAADAQHMAAEFVSRMNYDRAPLAALALTTDSSALTATGNDYGYDHVFERQVQALGRPGDVFLGISTSGRSPTVLRALEAARAAGLVTLGFTGAGGGTMAARCDLLLRAPSPVTALIQQVHIIAVHIVCSLVERALCPRAAA